MWRGIVVVSTHTYNYLVPSTTGQGLILARIASDSLWMKQASLSGTR